MKKWIGGMIVGVTLASTMVASAAGSVTADDASSVKFMFNGQQKSLPDGYTALSYQGHTYVPARFVAEQLGANVSWDDSSQTITVTKINNPTKDIEVLKLYSRIADNYMALQNLGVQLEDTGFAIDYAIQYFWGNKSTSEVDIANKSLNTAIDTFNGTADNTKKVIADANKAGIDVSDMNDIASKYYNAIDKYKASIHDLYTYADIPSDENYQKFSGERDTGMQLSMGGTKAAYPKYLSYFGKIQFYGY